MDALALPLLAVVAGALSITSPCCLPLVPGYVSYVSSLPVSNVSTRERRSVTLRASLLFVGGFTIVFTVLGATASTLGTLLLDNLPVLLRISGVLIIAMGLSALGLFRLPWLQRERRLDLARIPKGPRGALPLGMAFALGWTPCIGPVLAGILSLASASGSVAAGATLLALYSIGLGLPFIAIALGYERLGSSTAFLRRHGHRIEQAGGVLLVLVGVGYLTETWTQLFIPLQTWFARLNWPPI